MHRTVWLVAQLFNASGLEDPKGSPTPEISPAIAPVKSAVSSEAWVKWASHAFQIAKLLHTLADTSESKRLHLLPSCFCSLHVAPSLLVRVPGGNRQTERGRLQGNLGRS